MDPHVGCTTKVSSPLLRESLSWLFSTKIEHDTWQQPIRTKSYLDREIDNFSSNSTLSTNSNHPQTS